MREVGYNGLNREIVSHYISLKFKTCSCNSCFYNNPEDLSVLFTGDFLLSLYNTFSFISLYKIVSYRNSIRGMNFSV